MGRQRSFDYKKAAALFSQGFSASELARKYVVSPQTIYHALKSQGVDFEQRGRVNYNEASELFQKGARISTLANRYGVCTESMRQGLHRRGFDTCQKEIGLRHVLDDITSAYLAGLFDGEGSINILVNKQTGQIWLQISITSTNTTILKWLGDQIGGHIRKSGNKPPRRPCYHWSLCSVQASDFLKFIRPYLKIKDQQADVAVEFQSRLSYGTTISNKEREIRLGLKQKLEALR